MQVCRCVCSVYGVGSGQHKTGCCWFRAACVVQGVGTMHVHHHLVRITWLLQGLLTVVYALWPVAGAYTPCAVQHAHVAGRRRSGGGHA